MLGVVQESRAGGRSVSLFVCVNNDPPEGQIPHR